MKTLLYANRAEPKSIPVISILLLALNYLLNYVACIGSVISLLRKIFGITKTLHSLASPLTTLKYTRVCARVCMCMCACVYVYARMTTLKRC